MSGRSTAKKPKHTYGAKRSGFSSTSAAIFGRTSDATKELTQSSRSALDDVTEAINNIKLVDQEEPRSSNETEDENHVVIEEVASADGEEEEKEIDESEEEEEENTKSDFLDSLSSAYLEDLGTPLETRSWHHVLPSRGFQLDKIAEASYAEVYRVTSWKTRKESERTSILKIMRLISPHDPSSYECETAMEVGNVVSEFRIMNALTELPGFVTFKGAFLIQGQPGKHYFKAWDKFHHESKEGSYFTDPRFYDENTTFLVIELGDAGTVLEDYQIESIDELWDIYLGTVIALAKGEMACEFEHRDLHENNICVASRREPPTSQEADPRLRYGFSGLEVTLIDYGLSRATLYNGEIMFNDLEQDLEVFRGSDGHPQFNCYRKMRSHLFTNTRTMQKRAWHNEESRLLCNDHDWSEHRPYNNVIWIQFLLNYLKKQLARRKEPVLDDLKEFSTETVEMSKRMDPRTKIENGAFISATQVLEYVIAQGWVSCEQAEVVGTSELSILPPSDSVDDEPSTALPDRSQKPNVQDTVVKRGGTRIEVVITTSSSIEEQPKIRRSPRKMKGVK